MKYKYAINYQLPDAPIDDWKYLPELKDVTIFKEKLKKLKATYTTFTLRYSFSSKNAGTVLEGERVLT